MGASVFHLGELSEETIFIDPLPNAQHRALFAVGLNKWDQVNMWFCMVLSGYFDKKQEVYQDSGHHVQDVRRRKTLQFQAVKNLIFLVGGVGMGQLDGGIKYSS